MTTAHRPTWHAAMGGENQSGNKKVAPTFMQRDRDLPQEMTMKMRGGDEWKKMNKTAAEYRAELEERELELKDGNKGKKKDKDSWSWSIEDKNKLGLGLKDAPDNSNFYKLPEVSGENPYPQDWDLDFGEAGGSSSSRWKPQPDSDSSDDSDSDSDSDSEDEAEALQRELEKIKKEKEEEREKKEAEQKQFDEEERFAQMATANPLLADKLTGGNGSSSSSSSSSSSGGLGGGENLSLKRRWDDDTVFKNQARNAPKVQRRFINDSVRSDFHKRFLQKYIR